MTYDLVIAVGGVGIFLIGMIVLTDALRKLSGDTVRHFLSRFTKAPLRGTIAGALTTAVVQSSSATTVTTVGFVGAGLLTFSQGLGIIVGANAGTTATGWLVLIFGFKLKIGAIAMPLIFVGAMLHLFAKGHLRQAGWAIAGFGLLFVGIDTMQTGMAAYQGVVTPESFPSDTVWGRLQLVLLGILVTLMTQSSSAGVATALVALEAGVISFPQVAALVIGMDVGTTFTAALATVGGSIAIRRVGLAHVIYNCMTAVMAFLLLGPYVAFMSQGGMHIAEAAQMSLVAFHTFFNVLGVLLVLPVAGGFARLIQHLIPDRSPRLTRQLDEGLLEDPGVAIDAASATLHNVAVGQFRQLSAVLSTDKAESSADVEAFGRAINKTSEFVTKIRAGPETAAATLRLEHIVHALDHCQRLNHRLTQEDRIRTLPTHHRLKRLAAILNRVLVQQLNAEPPGSSATAEEHIFGRIHGVMDRQLHRYRDATVVSAIRQQVTPGEMLLLLDAAPRDVSCLANSAPCRARIPADSTGRNGIAGSGNGSRVGLGAGVIP